MVFPLRVGKAGSLPKPSVGQHLRTSGRFFSVGPAPNGVQDFWLHSLQFLKAAAGDTGWNYLLFVVDVRLVLCGKKSRLSYSTV